MPGSTVRSRPPRPIARGRALAMLPTLALLGARPAPPPEGELMLDAADPVIEVMLAGVPLRLRVDLAQQDTVELNPAAAARLPVRWERDLPLDVGRVRLPGRVAGTTLVTNGRTVAVEVSEHGRDCCRDADGATAPGLLPYAAVRWHRADAPAPDGERSLPLTYAPETGLAAIDPTGVRVRFDLAQADSSGTAAAGGLLARAWGGRWAGPPTRMAAAFGVDRPVRPIAFARPGTLAGFAVASLPVRIADFAGHAHLPEDPVESGDIVVRHRFAPQHSWPAVTIGADRLRRCRDLRFTARPLALALSCAFGG